MIPARPAPQNATIIAPASALGGGVAVLRVSGPLSGKVFTSLTGADAPPTPRQAVLCKLCDPVTGRLLDRAVALYFKGPASFTGEDVLELHIHGSKAVADSIFSACLALDPSIRLAEGGEFTKRAYLNGKLDLTAAEAIADLVAAETQAQADQALAQMGGVLHDLYEGWRHDLVRLLAYLEASIDFVDEEDVPESLLASTAAQISGLLQAMQAHLDDKGFGERLRDGFPVAVIGAPNAGKSSLVNALAKRDVAIVTPHAGTTRDILEVPLNLGGYPVIIMDTAGLRHTDDVIEAEGISRARNRAANADLVVALFDATAPVDEETWQHVTPETLVLWTKQDLCAGGALPHTLPPLAGGGALKHGVFAISTQNGVNMDRFLSVLTGIIRDRAGNRPAGMPVLTRARHREAVQEACNHLQRAIAGNKLPELLAEDIRLATRALGRITGRVDVEDLLDVIFRDFCIGK